MRTITKIKSLMWDNDIKLSQNGGEMEMIITNKGSGNSHMVSDKNWTNLLNKAIKDTKSYSSNKTLKF